LHPSHVQNLQHGLNLCRFLEIRTRLRPHFVHGNAICQLNEGETLCKIDVEDTL